MTSIKTCLMHQSSKENILLPSNEIWNHTFSISSKENEFNLNKF